MSNIGSAVLNGLLEGIIIYLDEGNLDNVASLSKSYQRIKSSGVVGEDVGLVEEALDKLLKAIQQPNPQHIECFSKAYQSIKSVQTTSVSDLQQFFKATQGAV